MKKLLVLLLCMCMLFTGCAQMHESLLQEKTTEFTDSLDRTVTVPEKITKIAISGPLSQVLELPRRDRLSFKMCRQSEPLPE